MAKPDEIAGERQGSPLVGVVRAPGATVHLELPPEERHFAATTGERLP